MRLTFEDGAGEILSLQLQIQGPQVVVEPFPGRSLNAETLMVWHHDFFAERSGEKKMKKGVGEPGSIGWYGTLMKRM